MAASGNRSRHFALLGASAAPGRPGLLFCGSDAGGRVRGLGRRLGNRKSL